MKALTCEMCGSTNLIKDGGVFVCQSCGTKYSLEEAKKMMVEGTVDVKGTVKVDVSDELKNLYELAHRAKETDNSENAQKYYDMILVKDPSSWEANFYAVYYKAMSCKIAYIASAGNSVANCIPTVLDLIIKAELDEAEQTKAISDIYLSSRLIANMLYNAATNHYEGIDIQIKEKYTQEWIDNCVAAETIVDILANSLEDRFGDKYSKFAIDCWKKAIEMRNKLIPNLADKDANANLLKTWGNKIRKYEPEFKDPEVNKGGCYVATAVYGSYNCPEVWTLRRFRDYTLDETWYGRTFIKMYYAISPSMVRIWGDSETFKSMWRKPLDRLVRKLHAKGVLDTPYIDKY